MSFEKEVPVPQFYFDLCEGRLIVGDQAYDDALEAGANPLDLPTLRAVLISPENFTLDKQPPLDVSSWRTDQYVELTSWLGRQVIGEEARLKDSHFKELYRLGLGPSEKQIGARRGYSALYEKAGLTNVYKRGVYDGWSIDRFSEHVCSIAAKTPKTESIKDQINEASGRGEGPSYKVISRRSPGGLKKLLERGGFYDFQNADIEDYSSWGVDFMMANGGRRIDTDALDLLSPKRRGPSRSGVNRHFGTIDAFNLVVEDLYFEDLERRQARNGNQLQRILEGLDSGDLPTSLLTSCTSEAEMRHEAGKYWLLQKLCDGMTKSALAAVAKRKTDSVVAHILKQNSGKLKIGDVEEAALILDVFDDVWPIPPKNALKM